MCLPCGCEQYFDNHDQPAAFTADDVARAADVFGLTVEQATKNAAAGCISLLGSGTAAKTAASPKLASCRVIKSAIPQRFTLGVAYPANKPDVSRAADGHRDFVSAEVLEKTAWEWLTKYRDVNLFHSEGTLGHFTPTESYIWRGPDWTVESPVDGKAYVVKAGDWMLGGVWDDLGWAHVQAQLVNGWSPEGGARRGTPSPERLAQLRSA